jgi:hypothetical protein
LITIRAKPNDVCTVWGRSLDKARLFHGSSNLGGGNGKLKHCWTEIFHLRLKHQILRKEENCKRKMMSTGIQVDEDRRLTQP